MNNKLSWVGDYMLSELYEDVENDISVGLYMDKTSEMQYCISYLDGEIIDSWENN